MLLFFKRVVMLIVCCMPSCYAHSNKKELVDHQYDTIRLLICAAIITGVLYYNRDIIQKHYLFSCIQLLVSLHSQLSVLCKDSYEYISLHVENPWARILGFFLLVNYSVARHIGSSLYKHLYPYVCALFPLLQKNLQKGVSAALWSQLYFSFFK